MSTRAFTAGVKQYFLVEYEYVEVTYYKRSNVFMHLV